MKQTYYTGVFKSFEGNSYNLRVGCNGFLQAFFLLTADAIRLGKHYQLESITDDEGNKRLIDDIVKCSELIK